MTQDVLLATALRLPHGDWEALIQGQTIAAMPWNFLSLGQSFALCSDEYLQTGNAKARFWAKCELCQSIDSPDLLDIVSKLTIWTKQALADKLADRSFFFLAHLRVYELPEPLEVLQTNKGGFLPVQTPVRATHSLPVLSDRIFAERKRKLQNLEPPEHPELEELNQLLSVLSGSNPTAQSFGNDLTAFLGWSDYSVIASSNPDLSWVNTIADLGNRSKEQDESKSNYQAGTDFEEVVRKSLEFLGFKLDYSHRGGAGGLDLFCSEPYPLVGECKAGKKIPNDTAVQLLNLGTLRLKDQRLLRKSAKLIIGPGEPTDQLREAASVHHMAIINPETLEKLVKLQSQYYGSVDLVKLKNYLKPGRADDEVMKYISQVTQAVKLRAQIVQSAKEICESEEEFPTSMEVKAHYNARFAKDASARLASETVRDLLVELSSPLAGYLGRTKGEDGSDRFYFLRPLKVEP